MFFGNENMGITFGILSISALPPEILRNIFFGVGHLEIQDGGRQPDIILVL